MLKKISRLFLGLVVCAGSACVAPTHASSATGGDTGWLPEIVFTRIQASGEFGAKDEYIVLHNNSGIEVDITDMCVMNKQRIEFACFTNRGENFIELFYAPPYGDIVVVSNDFAEARLLSSSAYTLKYGVTNNSSGSIVNSSDLLILYDSGGAMVDIANWATAIPTGKVLSRMLLLSTPPIYANSNASADWLYAPRLTLPVSGVIKNIYEFTQPEAEVDDSEPKLPEPNDVVPLLPTITEILANPAGIDTGKEFIELYNPNESSSISLSGYELVIGMTSVKTYAFPENAVIPPLSYVSFSDKEIGFVLNNTANKIQLTQKGENIGNAIEYASPKDDESWSVIDGNWQYTKYLTPGAPNALSALSTGTSANSKDAKPCADNQIRNPETGRCKLITTPSSSPVPCKSNQERNPETNRCRNIAATNTVTPCKEGQERNVETNRCRNIVKMSKAGHGVEVDLKAGSTLAWYYWVAIVAIVLLVLGYACWEWREELLKVWGWVRERVMVAKRPD